MDTKTHDGADTDADTGATTRSAEHVTELAAPAERAYGLIEDVRRWPLLFAPCIHSQELERTAGSQRIRLWAVVGSEVRSWTSLRAIDAAKLRIDFRQETPAAPLTEMSGHWQFEDTPYGGPGHLVLGHRWTTDGDPSAADRIAAALDSNSNAEIGAVRAWAERPQAPEELIHSFSDRVLIDAPAAEVYDFLYRAELWPGRLPHVARLDLETSPAGPASAGAEVQTMDMDTRAGAGGTVHTTQSVRLCFAGERIVYKQTSPPRGLLAHSGEWSLSGTPEGTLVTARHSVALDPAALEEVFGPGTGLAEAREKVRAALGGNSQRTLQAARAHVEGTRR
jgi:aromatase